MAVDVSKMCKFAMFYKRNQRNLMSEARALNSFNSIGFISGMGGFVLSSASQFVPSVEFVYEISYKNCGYTAFVCELNSV